MSKIQELIRAHTYISCLLGILFGCGIMFASKYWGHEGTVSVVFFNIGLAIMTSFLVLGVQTFCSKPNQDNEITDTWKLTKIYEKRSEKNKDSDPRLDKAKEHVDVVAFGLKSFRENYTNKAEMALNKGCNFRIITMNPDSRFATQRDMEEHNVNGDIEKSIRDLIAWADNLNSSSGRRKKKNKGKIIIKGYDCMTLDFYWRVDDEIYFGPYQYGKGSSDTITFKFEKGGRGFENYSQYFEKLWNDDSMKILTKTKG